MYRRVARLSLIALSHLMRIRTFENSAAALEAFLAALSGRGGGSGWNHKQQIRAILGEVNFRTGMVVLDVGGNNGKWSRSVYEQVSQYAPEFHIFECAPYCFEHLENNTRDIEKLSIVKKAVSTGSGYAMLKAPILPEGVGSGLASLHQREDSSITQHDYEEIRVETVSLDEYIKTNGIEHVDLLKVDVEGHELSVFEGAASALQSKISIVSFEFGSGNVNSRTFFRDFWSLFNDFGFSMYRILPCGKVLEIRKYEDRLEYFRGASNIVCVKRTE